jgi:hypothetical protein
VQELDDGDSHGIARIPHAPNYHWIGGKDMTRPTPAPARAWTLTGARNPCAWTAGTRPYPHVYELACFTDSRKGFPPLGVLNLAAAIGRDGHLVRVFPIAGGVTGWDSLPGQGTRPLSVDAVQWWNSSARSE